MLLKKLLKTSTTATTPFIMMGAAIGSLGLSGCSPMSATAVQAAATSSGGAALSAINYSCLDNLADYQLNTSVIDFELQGGGGVTAGFAPSGIALSQIGLTASYAQGQLITEMQLSQPLKPGVNLIDVQGTATQKAITFGANFVVSLASLGANYYSTTPVSALSASAIATNWTNVGTALSALSAQPEWWTHITQMNGAYNFFVPVGTNAGVQVGDQLQVMNASYYWTGGSACTGEFEMAVINTTTPLAVATVQSVSSDTAYLVVDPSTITGSLATYDYVSINKLVQPTAAAPAPCTNFLGIGCPSTSSQLVTARTSLGHSLKIGTISSKPLTFEGGTTVDISPYVQSQLQTLLSGTAGAGYYLHN